MIVCSCNVLSDHEVRDVVTAAGSQSLTAHQVYGCLGCSMQCGRCARAIKRILNETPADCAGGCAGCPASRPSYPSQTFDAYAAGKLLGKHIMLSVAHDMSGLGSARSVR